MSLEQFCRWCETLGVSVAIRNSYWQFAVVQSIHLCVLAVLAGAILIVDLRLLGRGLKQQPLAQVARDAQPWLIGALFGMLATGLPQFITNAQSRYHGNPFFTAKMSMLAVALIFTFTIRRKVTLIDEARLGPVWPKVVGLFSITIWFSIAVAGRAIGFY